MNCIQAGVIKIDFSVTCILLFQLSKNDKYKKIISSKRANCHSELLNRDNFNTVNTDIFSIPRTRWFNSLNFSGNHFIGKRRCVGNDKVTLVPSGIIAYIFSNQPGHIIKFVVPQLKFLQYPLPVSKRQNTCQKKLTRERLHPRNNLRRKWLTNACAR